MIQVGSSDLKLSIMGGLFKKGNAVRVSTEFTSASISINLCGTKSLAALIAANESLSGAESSKNLELK